MTYFQRVIMASPIISKLQLQSLCSSCTRNIRLSRRESHKIQHERRQRISTYGYTQAKALVYSQHGEPSDVLSLHTHSISPPHNDLLTLRTLAAPLNPADINQIAGTYPARPQFTPILGTVHPSAVPGNEAVFEVLSTGQGVKTVSRGDWVIAARSGLGTWRTHAQVPETAVVPIGDRKGLSALQVGTVSVNPVTAWQLLKGFVDLREGEWYVLNGANSGVGRAMVQLGRRWGLRGIAIVRKRKTADEDEMMAQELKTLGAEIVVSETEVAEKEFVGKLKEWTAGDGVRLGLNCVGGSAAMAMAKCLGKGGTMVTYGGMSRQPMRVPASMQIFKDLRFLGFWLSRWGDENPEAKKEIVKQLLDMYREGSLKDVPYMEVPWDWATERDTLVQAVQGTLKGYRDGKGVFVFGDT